MKSTITLFYKSLVNKEKNFVLDDGNGNSRLEQYLSTLQKVVINDFQYIKIQLSLSIKIDMNQINLEMIDSKDLNYVKIQNGTERAYYYFVVSKTWRSKETIELVLAMDTLNCFKFNSDYIINEKTLVKRMHKDRFENISPESRDGFLTRKIDLKSEDISAPTFKTSEETLFENEGESTIDWSLYYKTADNQETTPIDCYLVPSEAMSLYYQQASGELNSSNVPNGRFLIFSPTYPSGQLTFKYGDTTLTIRQYTDFAETGYILFAVFNDNGTIKCYAGTIRDNTYIGQDASWTLVYTGNPKIMNSPDSVKAYEKVSLPTASSWYGGEYLPAYAQTTINMGALVESTLYGNNSIDKTLDTNVKIINIPYSPTPFSVDSQNVYTFDECWTYNSLDGKLKLTDFNKRFKNPITSNARDFYDKFLVFIPDYAMLNGEMLRYFKDSKLFHSDYFRPKFVYDSFTKTFPMEQIEFEYDEHVWQRKFKFDFVMSRNIVSKFLFKFNYTYKHANEDYPNIVAVSRNNEEVLYNSQYLNYIRTGYNYDLKAKERTETASGIGIGLNVAALAASIGLSFVPGAQAIGIGSAVASGLGLVGQIVNYAKNSAQNEENIQRKLQETQRQSVSVLNADDYDLLYEYTQNKAKLCYYQISQRMEAVLDDLFYYGGYLVNEQMIPNISSRYWFNYVQASLVINDSSNLTSEIEDDIKEKFEQGVTFLHYKKNKFDFKQEMENIEVFLYRNVQ